MYALTTTTLLRQAGIMPTWLAIVSYLLALFLLVSTTLHPVVVLIFPTRVVVTGLVGLHPCRPRRRTGVIRKGDPHDCTGESQGLCYSRR